MVADVESGGLPSPGASWINENVEVAFKTRRSLDCRLGSIPELASWNTVGK